MEEPASLMRETSWDEGYFMSTLSGNVNIMLYLV
jgi:hypothetical protein